MTSILETGNQIAQTAGQRRRRYAERLATVIEQAKTEHPPWIIRAVTWDHHFLDELLAGNSTGSSLVDLLGAGRMGTGDTAILVERDQFKRETAYVAAEIWTRDAELAAFGERR